MAPLSFEARSDRYNNLAMAFVDDPESLAAIDYGVHFTARSTAWKNGDVKNYRTTFFHINEPESGEDMPQELVVNLIGEVASEGSELGACGNAWLRPEQKITDKTSVKDVLVLKVPTASTPSLAILYENQIRTLEGVYEKVELPVPMVRAAVFVALFSLIQGPRPTRLPTAPLTRMKTMGPGQSPLFFPTNTGCALLLLLRLSLHSSRTPGP